MRRPSGDTMIDSSSLAAWNVPNPGMATESTSEAACVMVAASASTRRVISLGLQSSRLPSWLMNDLLSIMNIVGRLSINKFVCYLKAWSVLDLHKNLGNVLANNADSNQNKTAKKPDREHQRWPAVVIIVAEIADEDIQRHGDIEQQQEQAEEKDVADGPGGEGGDAVNRE